MCGRYSLHHTTDQVVLRFNADRIVAPVTERYNIAPSQPVPVIAEAQGTRTLGNLQWGLIPSWVKDPITSPRPINARAETLAEKPSFQQPLVRRRCIIPADGFFEWQKEGSIRQPMYVRRLDGNLFAFAGLWEEWRRQDGTPRRTCAIITVAPNELMRPIHNRMPAILRPEDEAAWLDAGNRDIPALLRLLRPYPEDWMEAFAVSKRVNAPTIDDPDLIQPLLAANTGESAS